VDLFHGVIQIGGSPPPIDDLPPSWPRRRALTEVPPLTVPMVNVVLGSLGVCRSETPQSRSPSL
jgi:hypothetical protein